MEKIAFKIGSVTKHLCTVVGAVTVGIFIYKVTKLSYHLVRRPHDLSQYGDWSIVTGATDGIGRAIAFELARHHQNILIIGRNLEKLNSVYNEISTTYTDIMVEYCEIDLSLFSDSDSLKLRYLKAIASKNIAILVNNAAVCYDEHVHFHQLPLQRINNIIKVNTLSLLNLTYHTIHHHLKCKSEEKLNIINISSGSSLLPSSYFTVYASSKVFLNRFSSDLDQEYSKIIVQAQICGQVITKMLPEVNKTSILVTTPAIYAKYAVKHIGYSGICSPYPPHAVLFFLIDLLPQCVIDNWIDFLWKIYSMIQYVNLYGNK